MGYFITPPERDGTDYYEFVRGRRKEGEGHFRDDSLLISAGLYKELHMGRFFKEVVEDYDPYGETVVGAYDWAHVLDDVENATELSELEVGTGETAGTGSDSPRAISPECYEAFAELAAWADEVVADEGCFTIVGI